MTVHQSEATTRFMWSVQSLSLPAELQARLFPDFVDVADELVLEHDEVQRNFIGSEAYENLSEAQRAFIDELDRFIEKMSARKDMSLWTDAALKSRQEWQEVRRLARGVLRAMNWPEDVPPTDRGNVYVGPPE